MFGSERGNMRVLMLGNSATYSNDMPNFLQKVTNFEVFHITQGKASLSDFLNTSKNVGFLFSKVMDDKWDYIVLQDLTLNPSINPQIYEKNIANFVKIFQEKETQLVVYETWAYREGAQKLIDNNMSSEQMFLKTTKTCSEVAKKFGLVLARVGEAFYERGEQNLLVEDGCHPNNNGSRLAGCVIADAIMGTSLLHDISNWGI